ncbi:cupin [Orrella sp. NBD-18]|uniref:Cupin n=1 Tax=Sheuella amnicola TaxID=2707330 RepID=A0A6B2R776_9BURK|nr:cupin domain-containing protein [Sheuella amnicola]NDY83195.1 cupin [Sheuella amnicola]HBI84532.1 cupin [Alcaligenaceae bacterium]
MSARPQAQPTVQIDNDRAIVTEWKFTPGAETGWHTHGHDYIVVPMTNGLLHLETPDGLKAFELVAGQSYTRNAGVNHNVINASDQVVIFVEIEIR